MALIELYVGGKPAGLGRRQREMIELLAGVKELIEGGFDGVTVTFNIPRTGPVRMKTEQTHKHLTEQ